VPNFFVTYFGQQLVYGDLSDNDNMAKLTHLESGYELWANIAKEALEQLDDTLTIMEKVNTPERIKKYFNPIWDKDKSLPLATINGHFGIMTMVQSEDYPVAARAIKDLFRLTPQAAANLGISPQENVMLQLPGEINKESEAKNSIIKLMLLHKCGDIDINSTSIMYVNLATPSKGMQLVSNQHRAARASQFADLVQLTLDLAKQQDYTNIQSSQIFIRVMSKVLVAYII
jgi:hypothetical protein